MKIYTGKHSYVRQALPTGGKAGKGCNATSSFKAFYEHLEQQEFKVRTFRFMMDSYESLLKAKAKAIAQAKAWDESA